MKKILTVYTGGTICCEADGQMRDLNPKLAKRALISNFARSSSEYAKYSSELFEDSEFENQTLSENMTLEKLSVIINHIKSFDLDGYRGVIVMHGTDTLAFTASIFAFVFSYIEIPLMLVSGNRPPLDEKSNANENFRTAVELVMKGITPNIYVPYRNSDNRMYIHLGTNIMQCGNYSEDFYGVSDKKTAVLTDSYEFVLDRFKTFTKKSVKYSGTVTGGVLCINPYTGLDYSKIGLEGVKVIIHGTYHSGTVCVEADGEKMSDSPLSVLYLAKECEKKGIELFIAPSVLDADQYSSVYHLKNNCGAELLNMTTESAYMKAIVAVSCGFTGDNLKEFMKTEINCEMIN